MTANHRPNENRPRIFRWAPEIALAALAALTLAGCPKTEPAPDVSQDPGVGDLRIVAAGIVAGDDGAVSLDLELFDNLSNPDTIGVLVKTADGRKEALALTCTTVAGQVDTCTGGAGTCSGNCPDREYAELPNMVFSGTCTKPSIGLQVCSCIGYRVKGTLRTGLHLAPGDEVTVVLDPEHRYAEASEDNNSITVVFDG